MRTKRKSDGFTLLELLLAIAILGVLVGIVAATFHTAVTAWQAGSIAADASHHADAVMEQVVMGLRSAFYPESTEPLYAYGFTHEDDGDMPTARDTISWVKLGNALVGEDMPYAGVPHRVELSVKGRDGPDGEGLYVRSWRLDGQPDDFDTDDVPPLLLSREVAALDCRMLDPAKKEGDLDESVWMDDWDTTNRIPTRVLISIAIRPATDRKEQLVLERVVTIPLADLSWNPVVTGEREDPSRRGRSGRRGAAGSRGASATGSGRAGGSRTEGRFERSSSGGASGGSRQGGSTVSRRRQQ